MGNAATSKKGDSAENGKKHYIFLILTDALNDGTFDIVFSVPFL